MSHQCRDKAVHTAVSIECRTSKCWLPSTDTGQHIVEIENRRSGPLHKIEITSVTSGGQLDFKTGKDPKKFVAQQTLLSDQRPANRISQPIGIGHSGSTNTDLVQTTVEFYDATQRVGSTFVGAPETYQVDYQINLTP